MYFYTLKDIHTHLMMIERLALRRRVVTVTKKMNRIQCRERP